MANRYHINPDTGRPNGCRALKRCPFGGEESHYESKAEAQAAYEKQMEDDLLNGKSNNNEARNPTVPKAPASVQRSEEEIIAHQMGMNARLRMLAFNGGSDAFLDKLDSYESALSKSANSTDDYHTQESTRFLDSMEKLAKSRSWFKKEDKKEFLDSIQGLRNDLASGTHNSLPQWKADQLNARVELTQQIDSLAHKSHAVINEEYTQRAESFNVSPVGDRDSWNNSALETLDAMKNAAGSSPHWKSQEEKDEWMNRCAALRHRVSAGGPHSVRSGAYDGLYDTQKDHVKEHIDRNDADWAAYYAATERKHFGDASTPGSKFTAPYVRGLDDVLATAINHRATLYGDDKEKLIALGSDPKGFSEDKRYIMVKTEGTVGVKNMKDFSDDTPLTVTRTKPGVPCSLVASVDSQPTADYGVIVVNKPKLKKDPFRLITAFPGPVTKPLKNDEIDALEGKQITVAQARKLLGEDVYVNTRVK